MLQNNFAEKAIKVSEKAKFEKYVPNKEMKKAEKSLDKIFKKYPELKNYKPKDPKK